MKETKYKKTSKYNGVSKSGDKYRLDVNIEKTRFTRILDCEYRASQYVDIIKLGYSWEFAKTNHPKENYNKIMVDRFYKIYISKKFM